MSLSLKLTYALEACRAVVTQGEEFCYRWIRPYWK
jgi:hypothetical protein